MEIWKDVKDYEGLYQVSNLGRIKSIPRNGTIKLEKILKPSLSKDGYYKVSLNKNGKQTSFRLHRIVAIAFLENRENKPQVDHINTDRLDNRADNLRWCTFKENVNNPITLSKRFGKKHSKETKVKMSLKALGANNSQARKVNQYTLDYKYIKTWDCIADIVRAMNLKSKSSISNCCKFNLNVENKKHKAKGYIWEYAKS